MRTLTLALAVLLAGCGAYDPDRSAVIRAVMLDQIATYNAAGIDPVQLAPDKLLYAALACGSLSAIGTVVDPTAPVLGSDLGDWCAAAVRAAAPAE